MSITCDFKELFSTFRSLCLNLFPQVPGSNTHVWSLTLTKNDNKDLNSDSTATLLLQQMEIIMIMRLRMVIRAMRARIFDFSSKATQVYRHGPPPLVSNIIRWNVSYCGATLHQIWRSYTAHIVSLSAMLRCKLLWGCSLDMVYYCSETCRQCQRSSELYEIWQMAFYNLCNMLRWPLWLQM